MCLKANLASSKPVNHMCLHQLNSPHRFYMVVLNIVTLLLSAACKHFAYLVGPAGRHHDEDAWYLTGSLADWFFSSGDVFDKIWLKTLQFIFKDIS